jgi:hypothetical protein
LLCHPAYRRWPEVKTCTGENLGGLHFPERRAEGFQAPHEVTHELGKPIDWFGQLDERVRSFLVESRRPRGDRKRAHLKNPRCLGERPAPDGAKFENGKSCCRRVVRSSVRLDLLHAGILDANLLTQELDLLPQPTLFSPLSKLRVHALRRPALG